jgi:hypothetical protein
MSEIKKQKKQILHFLGGFIVATYRMSEGIAKEREGKHSGKIEA